MLLRIFVFLFVVFPISIGVPLFPQQKKAGIFDYQSIHHPVVAKNAMVSTQSDIASKVGISILQKGGNAVDSAVAIGFALAVTLPRAGNIGGGGFMLVKMANKKAPVCIDYREKAPLASTPDMFLDKNGNVDNRKSRDSYLSIGVPGTVRGLALALKKYGTMTLQQVIAPAIDLAEKGFPVNYDIYNSIAYFREALSQHSGTKKIFFKRNGSMYQIGENFIQKDLANTLKKISKLGEKEFYQGSIAKQIVSTIQKHGGIISLEDMKKYTAIIRSPVQTSYRGYQIYSMPPPSSGGVHLIQLLNILENFPLHEFPHNSAKYIQLLTEAMKYAYRDRFLYLGDTDFASVPIGELISKGYAKKIAKKIDGAKVIPSQKILKAGPKIKIESNDTTHFSVIDSKGNMVSNTYTINFSYGMKAVAEGTGILLNNEMDDFTAKYGVENQYQLLGGKNNTIEPEKRMLSSMTPTIVLKNKKPYLITGSPGGSRIITTTLQIIVNAIDYKMNVAEATHSSRIHHQLYPDSLFLEKGISHDTIALLKKAGYSISNSRSMGSTQSILIDRYYIYGSSDPRRPGAKTIGY